MLTDLDWWNYEQLQWHGQQYSEIEDKRTKSARWHRSQMRFYGDRLGASNIVLMAFRSNSNKIDSNIYKFSQLLQRLKGNR